MKQHTRLIMTTAALLCAGMLVGTQYTLAAQNTAADSAQPAMNTEELRNSAKELLGLLPDKMPGAENDTSQMVQLGEILYFDTRLSTNNTLSCNSCHFVDKNRAGVDNEPTSDGAFHIRGDRNSPTVLNAGFQFAQFWDGRAADLVEQAKGPVMNPVEMAMPSEQEAVKRLKADAQYNKLFKKAFPKETDPITYDNMARAIAAFERTLITQDRFDDFQKGKDKALSTFERQGLASFLTFGCTTCHHGPLLGGNSYQKAGLVNPYENNKDIGRAKITNNEDDKFKFKVPMLRNVALTHPYFHDGEIKTLEEVVQKMAWMQLGLKLEKDQVTGLVAFLNSLSDKKRGIK
jgi:cytochrome c peroxidase